ncbi:MAG: flagellar biosynthesis protein FlhF [Spirochaetaceae bacterium]|nr:flagellar biosynthesis protein FlhF [Spirochaetaceae bacterium]
MSYEVFTLRATTYDEACRKARQCFGNQVQIRQEKPVRRGGFWGLFSRSEVEITGFFPENALRVQKQNLEEEKRKFLAMTPAAVKQDETLQEVLREVRSLGERVNGNAHTQKDVHPCLAKIRGLLVDNDFSQSYIEKITERIKKDVSLEALENFEAVRALVMDWIGESLSIYDAQRIRSSRVCILVGPTGVGKTTTIAGLAGLYRYMDNEPLATMQILTTDSYRVGAKEQIDIYGEALHIPVTCVNDAKELKKYLALYRDTDMILIDTAGRSPRDYAILGQMRELLDAAFKKKAGVHLVVSAPTKYVDLLDIMRQFEPFGYESLIVTKLDETSRVGSIISAAAEKGKPLSFITDGQVVGKSIRPAGAAQILERLTGFSARGNHLEEKIGAGTRNARPAREE